MKPKSWSASLMMIVSIVAACILVPAGFMLSNSFSTWLQSIGIHNSPNLADGHLIAEFSIGKPCFQIPPQSGNMVEIQDAVSLRRFCVKKVSFRPWSGMGIAPRLNLCFEFEGRLPDPHNSLRRFSMTVIHVYIKAPGREGVPSKSDKVAKVDFAGMDWNYQVIIDGFHDQARIFDAGGNLIGRGLGLYEEHQEAAGGKSKTSSGVPVPGSRLTAAVPLDLLGDPARGNWQYFVLVGLSDSGQPSMMLHSGPNGSLGVFSGAIADCGSGIGPGKPRLQMLAVNNRI